MKILKKYPITRVIIEATGRLEQPFIMACAEANIPFVIANPVNIKRFSGAIGQKANSGKSKKSITILSDVLVRKDKNSLNYIEYKALPIPDTYTQQRNALSRLRTATYNHFDYVDISDERTTSMLHFLDNGKYVPTPSAPNRQILEVLQSFDIEVLSDSNNTLRHFSGNALRHDPITSRALLGHNEDGFYYSSSASSSNINDIHKDILAYQNNIIKELDLKVLNCDFD